MTFLDLRALLLSIALAGAASAQPPSERLDEALSAALSAGALRRANASVLVERLEDGKVLFAHNPDALLNPASNVKLFTSAAALARLGAHFRFETEFFTATRPGPNPSKALIVRGKGDPTLTTERLYTIAGALLQRGVRSIEDGIVIDDSYFDGERRGPGNDEEGDRAYLAPAGAVSLNFNTVAVHLASGDSPGAPAVVSVDPESDFVRVRNQLVTAPGRAGRWSVRSAPAGAQQELVASGLLPRGVRDWVVHRKIDDPALYFGETLKRVLAQRGVSVRGAVRRGTVPPDAELVWVNASPPLAEVVRTLNKTSNNFIAEQVLKTLGAEVGGVPGSWPKGVAAVEAFLAELGIPRGSYTLRNGSGLNHVNQFTARQTVAVLRAAWARFPLMGDFLASLPVAGRDGTIRTRMEGSEAAGRVRAKTGTLENVISLSGYVETRGGERLAFAILVNDFAGQKTEVVRAVDALAAAIAGDLKPGPRVRSGRSAPTGPGVTPPPLLAIEESEPNPCAEPRACLEWTRSARARRDRAHRLRLEHLWARAGEPATRMLLAEASFRAEGGSGPAARFLLEAIEVRPAPFARLAEAAAALGCGFPLLESLSEIARKGEAGEEDGPGLTDDALAVLVSLAPLPAFEGKPGLELGAVLAELTRGDPTELMRVLRRAPSEATAAAVRLLAAHWVHSGEPELPGLADLETDRPDPFALELATQLQRQVQLQAAARLVSLAALAVGSPSQAAEYAGHMEEVCRRAPTELLLSLKSSDQKAADAFLTAVSSSGPARQACLEAFRSVAASTSGELEAFSRGLSTQLAARHGAVAAVVGP